MAAQAGTLGFLGGGMIAISTVDVRFAVARLNADVSIVRDFVSGTIVEDAPPGSQVLTEYSRALKDVMAMLKNLSVLLDKDVASYTRALDQIIERDNLISSRLEAGISGVVAGAVAGAAALK